MAIGNQEPKPVVTRGLPGNENNSIKLKTLLLLEPLFASKSPSAQATIATRLNEPQVTRLNEPQVTHLDEPQATRLDKPQMTHSEPEVKRRGGVA